DAAPRAVIAAAIAIAVAIATAVAITTIAVVTAGITVTIARLRARFGRCEGDGRADRYRGTEDECPEHDRLSTSQGAFGRKNAVRTPRVSNKTPDRAMNGMVNPLRERDGHGLAQSRAFPPHSPDEQPRLPRARLHGRRGDPHVRGFGRQVPRPQCAAGTSRQV